MDSKKFYLSDWEIWHTYTTYIGITKIDLFSFARDVVDSELAHLAMMRNGYTIWRRGEEIGEGLTEVNLSEDRRKPNIDLHKNSEETIDLGGYTLEAWRQASFNRFSEKRIFEPSSGIPPEYTRAYLGKCILTSKQLNQEVELYPILTVYDTGVLNVEFRSISSNKKLELDDFIKDEVNLFSKIFNHSKVPPALSKLINKAYLRSGNSWFFYQRKEDLNLEKKFDELVESETFKTDDLNFKLSPLRTPAISQEETLSSLSAAIFDAIAFLLSKPKKGWEYILKGQKSSVFFDGYWIGKPHVYLCEFDDQLDSATENERRHRELFIKILMRSDDFPSKVRKESLPKNVRLYNDYLFYIGPSASLLVWSKDGKEPYSQTEDLNAGYLTTEQQATMRMLDYVYILYRRLLNQLDSLANTNEIVKTRKDLNDFEQGISEISAFGEVRELFSTGLSQLDVDRIKKIIEERLELNQIEKSYIESLNIKILGIILTVLFGLSTIPDFSTQIINFSKFLTGIPTTENEIYFKIFLTVTMVLTLLLIIWKVFKPTFKSSNKTGQTSYFRSKN